MSPAHTPACWREVQGGVLLSVHVVPGASRTEAKGFHGEALQLRVAAPPVEGAANAAVCAWLADQLGLPKRRVSVLRGQSSRHKQCLLEGLDAAVLQLWLERLAP